MLQHKANIENENLVYLVNLVFNLNIYNSVGNGYPFQRRIYFLHGRLQWFEMPHEVYALVKTIFTLSFNTITCFNMNV